MKLNYLKSLSLQACESLAQISSEITHAGRQFRCAEFLHYAVDPDDLSMRLNRANFCKQRTCPVCCWLKSVKWRIRIFQGLPRLLEAYPGYPFLFLTLTVKNCHIGNLRSHIRMMEQGFSRLTDLQRFPAIGYLKSVEVTRPRDCFYGGHFVGRMGEGQIAVCLSHFEKLPDWRPSLWREFYCEECHPHMHVLMMVSPSYFTEAEYLDYFMWQAMWKMSARLDYKPIVDIRKVDQLHSAILECSKYCVKSNDMTDVLGCLLVRQLHKLRLLAIGGAFNDYLSQASIDAIAATGDLGTEQWQQGIPCWYEWNGQKYDLTRLADMFWELELV